MTITRSAPAKINLALDVVGKKDNGYHLVEMIMQTINLQDTVTVTAAAETSLCCNHPDVPTGTANICRKAWQLLKEQYQLPHGVRIEIRKEIPVAAGLAGGSTDGAATILAVNEEFQLGLSLAEMKRLGAQLGADVPFCLQKGTALATGIGDELQPLPACPPLFVVAVNGGFPVNTADVYRNLVWHQLPSHPNIKEMIKALHRRDAEALLQNAENVLEQPAFALFPVLRETKKQLSDLGIFPIMSGSGGTMLGLTPDREKAEFALARLRADFPFAGIFQTQEQQRNGA